MMSMLMRQPDEDQVELELQAALMCAEPLRLRQAMTDAVFPGGARIRPRLCLAVARAAAATDAALAEAGATAVELMHCASLVHDDLPCFDDADLRRGRPSIHRKYGEAMAVLVGDALIVAAFERLALVDAPASAIVALTRAAGARNGLVSGQALEQSHTGTIERYHQAKTGGLFEAAARLGAIAAGVNEEPFATLGRALGAFYQLADDAADRFGKTDVLGKPTGQDRANRRPSAFANIRDPQTAAKILCQATNTIEEAVPTCPGRNDLAIFLARVSKALIDRSVRSA